MILFDKVLIASKLALGLGPPVSYSFWACTGRP